MKIRHDSELQGDDHAASRRAEVLEQEAPHLLDVGDLPIRQGALLRIVELADKLLDASTAKVEHVVEIQRLARWLYADETSPLAIELAPVPGRDVYVRYTDPEEFVAEVEREHEHAGLATDAVRVTKLARGTRAGITNVTVVATALLVDDTIVRLDHRVGDLWGQTEIDDKVQAAATAAVDLISDAGRQLGLDVRGGVYRFAGEDGL